MSAVSGVCVYTTEARKAHEIPWELQLQALMNSLKMVL